MESLNPYRAGHNPDGRGPTARGSDSEGLGWELRFCISDTFPGGAAVADVRTDFVPRSQTNDSAVRLPHADHEAVVPRIGAPTLSAEVGVCSPSTSSERPRTPVIQDR